ncbi:T9SS type B sorting domain-containing protein [Robertkochia sediminum]|uniref:T9SS type B sorting domain-containing protein n=1 Tax=Robertkochia sediminum TaxID=2785326 RepID=UPI0019338A29|nr:T9SS type B sorting domain-containing protein [Robertkochia sediminum]MBL7471738.1 T9SS type B sorting domain-containing protein [Robertkochia sediminum]
MKSTATYLHNLLLLAGLFLLGYVSTYAQVKNDLEVRYQSNIRGDITFIANNIMNRDDNAHDPEDPYNATGTASQYNDRLNMQYIDIDDDPSTFSSSSADLIMNDLNCTRIRYAGLYWGAVYPFDGDKQSNGRSDDFNQIKFSIPGGTYQDITADEILFDGLNDSDFGSYSPYICYKDVTALVTSLDDPTGTYTVANIRAATGGRNIRGGISGGWTLILVYENPTMPAKNIATFDGYAGIKSGETIDVPFNGFKTLPDPFPVNATLGVATLEGDNRITGDGLSFKADSNSAFTPLGDALNPANNFFNSNITHFENEFLDRDPNSRNTLGWDTDLIRLDNPANSLLPNDETGATLRASSTGDKYDIFFTSLAVEVIEPDIRLTKIVEDLLGNDITGSDVRLGQEMFYVLGFQNVGNDDAVNFTLRDVLPVNVDPILAEIEVPGAINGEQVTFDYDPDTHEIVFHIPDTYIEEDDPYYEINLKVKVLENCFGLRDACSNIIENTAYATYSGLINDAVISDDPSVAGFDACGLAIPGATNFLVDLEDCDFVRDEYLCGSEITLTAGEGFATFQWQTDMGGGNFVNIPGATNQTFEASAFGTYRVIKTAPAPCMEMEEVIHVIPFDNGATNPFLDAADEVVTCSNDGSQLPKFYLCGTNDTRFLDVTFSDAVSFEWQRLDEGCADEAIDDCPTRSRTCSWTTVSTSEDYTLEAAGEYRLMVVYQNGCFNQFYFKAYENSLDPKVNSRDIICDANGSITVSNIPSGYEFAITTQPDIFDQATAAWQSSGSFVITSEGLYTIFMRQPDVFTDSGTACLFAVRDVAVEAREFRAEVSVNQPLCPTDFGSIGISVYDAEPQYTYELKDDTGQLVNTYGPDDDNNHTFTSLPAGAYEVSVSTEDGCVYAEEVILESDSDLDLTARVSQHIVCDQGNILVESSGGQTPHRYAIWSYAPDSEATNAPVSYASIDDIPPSVYQTSVIFDIPFGGQGTYQFVVIDKNNCTALSNPVKIDLIPPVEYTVDPTDVSCFGATNGAIDVNVLPGQKGGGYRMSYELTHADGTVLGNTSGTYENLAPGDYELVVYQTHGNQTCEFRHEVTISQPDAPLQAEVVLVQDAKCDGTLTYSSGIIEVQHITGGTPPYAFSIDGLDYSNTTGRFEGLSPGTYTVFIQDSRGCTWSDNTTTVTPPTPPTAIDFDLTPVVCPSLSSDVTLSVNGGSGDLLYEIVAPAGAAESNTTGVFNDLTPDTYTFKVTDADGCAYEEYLTIDPITPIGVSGRLLSNVTCATDADGEVVFEVSNFNTFDYEVRDAANDPVPGASGAGATTSAISVPGLAAGNYTITVTDNVTSCSATASVTVTAPAAIAVAPAITRERCDAYTVTLETNGGWGTYTYELTYPDGTLIGGPQSADTFTGILYQTGDYSYTVTDVNGCSFTDTFTITAPVPLTGAAAANSSCITGAGGLTIIASASGGTAPYEYRVNGGDWQSAMTFSGLQPGVTYTVEVIDANGCTDVIDTSIEATAPLQANAVLIKDLDCNTAPPEAVIELNIAAGTPGYTYDVFRDGIEVASDISVSSLPVVYTATVSGDYTFVVSDNGPCPDVTTNTVTVSELVPVTYDPVLTNPSCYGTSDGVVDLNISGGTPPYSIFFDGAGPSAQQVYSGLSANTTYTFSGTDAKGCAFSGTVTLAQPQPITFSMLAQDVSCDSGSGATTPGSITVTITSGGEAPFDYYLYDSADDLIEERSGETNTSYTFHGLDYGFYYVRIVDANGCESEVGSERVAAAPYLDIAGAPVFNGCVLGASVTLEASGGSGNYAFEIYGTGTPPTANNGEVSPGVYEVVYDGLDPNREYVFLATDLDTGCLSYFEVTTPGPVNSMDVTVVAEIPSTCYGSDDGALEFTVANYDPGASALAYTIFERYTNTVVQGPVTFANPPSGIAITETVTGIAPGDYSIQITEIGGQECVESVNFRITEPTPVVAEVISNTNANCVDDTQVIVRATGGNGSYEYALIPDTQAAPSPGDWQIGQIFDRDPSITDNWHLYARDVNGCLTTPVPVSIAFDPVVDIEANLVDACAGEGNYAITVVIDPSGLGHIGIPPYRISLNGGAYQQVNTWPFTGYTNLTSGTYDIKVVDANGEVCAATDQVIIHPELVLNSTIDAQPGCDVNDGIVAYEVLGGSGSFTVELFDSSGDPAGIIQDTSGNPGDPSVAPGRFAGLAPGTYTVRVIDAEADICRVENTLTLDPAPQIIPGTPEIDHVTCNAGYGAVAVHLNGTNQAIITSYELEEIDAIGGTPIGGITRGPQASPFFNNLPAGFYRITLTSTRHCEATIDMEIKEPALLTATAAVTTDFTCNVSNGVSRGVITVQPIGGTAPYAYSMNGGAFQTSAEFYVNDTGSPETYTFEVRDANGCIANATVTVDPINAFTLDLTRDLAISCDDNERVTVFVATDNGNPSNSYTFELLPIGNTVGSLISTTANSATFDLTAPGDHTFRVTDNVTSCYQTITHTVAPFRTIEAVVVANTQVSCFGGADGAMELTINGYSGAYQYEVFDNNGNVVIASTPANTATDPLTINGLHAGSFNVAITALDAPFCDTISNTVAITAPDAPVLLDLQISRAITCDEQGQLIAYANGGSGTYEYQLLDADTGDVLEAFSSNYMFDGLSAGAYEVVVRDAKGCEAIAGITLDAPAPIAGLLVAGAPVLCEGATSGSITVTSVSGGRPESDPNADYLYILNYLDASGNMLYSSGGQLSPEFENLPAGSYSVTITDGWGCDFTTPVEVITEPDPVIARLRLASDNTCAIDAVVELTATGGTAPYYYSTDADGTFYPMTGSTISLTVPEGQYRYFVKDANGCVSQVSNAIGIGPVAPVIIHVDTISDVTCYEEATGYVEVRATGGLGNYTYTLLNAAQDGSDPVRPAQDTGVFTDLPAGVYYVRVDSEDCHEVTRIEIEEGEPIYASDPVVTQPACPDDLGTIAINLEGGTGIYQYAISPRLDQFREDNVFYDLEPGTYTVIAQDSKGCKPFVFEIDIVAPEPLVITPEILLQEYCEGEDSGIIALDITGGVAPYYTALNSNSPADYIEGQLVFEGLSGGATYTIFVKDASGCEQHVTVSLDAPVPFDPEVEVIYTCMDNVSSNEVSVHLGDDRVTDVIYSLDGGTDQFENFFLDVTPGRHVITAYYQGCERTLEFEVDAVAPLELSVSNEEINVMEIHPSGGYAPYTIYVNGEHMGSETIYRIEKSRTYEVVVVDAKGCEVRTEIYLEYYDLDIPNFFTPDGDGKNDLWSVVNAEAYDIEKTIVYDRYGRVVGEMHVGQQWDGTYNGSPLPAGDYWYVLRVEEGKALKEYVGHFTLYR